MNNQAEVVDVEVIADLMKDFIDLLGLTEDEYKRDIKLTQSVITDIFR